MGRRLARKATQVIPFDRRMRFRDVHLLQGRDRIPQSPVLQFYSSVDNIGNYLPVAAIRDYLGCATDTWSIHHPVDYDYVNANYRGVIVGGAGLIYQPFAQFWSEFAEKCRLPFIIWGVGACIPDAMGLDDAIPFRKALRVVAKQADLINVRDDISADLFSGEAVSVTACPSVSYLKDFTGSRPSGPFTLATHSELVSNTEHEALRQALRQDRKVILTNNIQSRLMGVDDIIRRRYSLSSTVVTTRLHGAIIAYGLGIPYVAMSRDEKLRAFTRIYGGGVEIASASEIYEAVTSAQASATRGLALEAVDSFAAKAASWMAVMGPARGDGARS